MKSYIYATLSPVPGYLCHLKRYYELMAIPQIWIYSQAIRIRNTGKPLSVRSRFSVSIVLYACVWMQAILAVKSQIQQTVHYGYTAHYAIPLQPGERLKKNHRVAMLFVPGWVNKRNISVFFLNISINPARYPLSFNFSKYLGLKISPHSILAVKPVPESVWQSNVLQSNSHAPSP